MNNVTIEVDGITDEDVIEDVFDERESGFRPQSAGFGRTKRFSHFGDVVVLVGQIVSLTSFAKTLLQLFNFSPSSTSKEVVIPVKNAAGETVTIIAADKEMISEILRNLQISGDNSEQNN